MKNTCLAILFVLFISCLKAQTVPAGSMLLNDEAAHQLLPDSVKQRLGIILPVFKVFEYSDKFSKQYLILTEKEYRKENGNSQYDSIKALVVSGKNGTLQSLYTITDFIYPGKEIKGFTDYSVWFWTKYISVTDMDGDGVADPVIVYGTAGSNQTDDGKIKIAVCYKGKKYLLRHQNGVLDSDRNTNVDRAYYTLPVKMQVIIKKRMQLMTDNGHAIFPAGWEKAMQQQKTFFSENNN